MSNDNTKKTSYQPLTPTSNSSNSSSSPTTSIATFPTVLRMRSIKHFDASTLSTEKISTASTKKSPTPQHVPTSKNSDYRVTVRSASISGGGIVVVQEKKLEAPEITYLSRTPSASGGGVIVVQNNPPPSPPSTTPTKMRTSGGGIVAQPSPTSPATMHTLRSNAFHGGCLVRVGEKSTASPVEPRLEIDLAKMGIDFHRMSLRSEAKCEEE